MCDTVLLFIFFIEGKLQEAEESKKQMKQELYKVREEENSVLREYELVMSERASVHQEIQELQENLVRTKVCWFSFL